MPNNLIAWLIAAILIIVFLVLVLRVLGEDDADAAVALAALR